VLRNANLSLAEVVYPAHSRLPRHAHECAYFCLIRRGGYQERYGRRLRECVPNMLVFHPPGEPHTQSFGDLNVNSFNVELGSPWLRRMAEAGLPMDRAVAFTGGQVVASAHRLFREFTSGVEDSALDIESVVAEILNGLQGSPPAANPPPWLRRVREMLHSDLLQKFSLADLAEQAGVHPVHLAAVFRSNYGYSPGEYLRRQRIEFARRRLVLHEVPLVDIAAEAGFADQSHLTRLFKRYTGVTPAQYRALH
jgi:AraC family transcriptional regulator